MSDDSSPDNKADESSNEDEAEEFANSSQGTSSKKIQGLQSGEPLEFNFEATPKVNSRFPHEDLFFSFL